MHNDYKVKTLHIMLPNTNANVRSYDGQTKWMPFFIENDDLLEKHNFIWDTVSSDEKKFFLKTKIKSYGVEVTDFCDKKFLRGILMTLV